MQERRDFRNYVAQARRNQPPPPAPRYPNLLNSRPQSAPRQPPNLPRYQLNTLPPTQAMYTPNKVAPQRQAYPRQQVKQRPIDRVDPFLGGGQRNNVMPSVPPTRQTDLFKDVNRQVEITAGKQRKVASNILALPQTPKQTMAASNTPTLPQKAKESPKSPSALPSKTSFLILPTTTPTKQTTKPTPARPRMAVAKKRTLGPSVADRYGSNVIAGYTPAPAPPKQRSSSFVSVQKTKSPPPPHQSARDKLSISSPPKKSKLHERYPGLISKRSSSHQTQTQQLDYFEPGISNGLSFNNEEYLEVRPESDVSRHSVSKSGGRARTPSPSFFKKSHQIWSPSGNLGLGINNILKSSIVDGSESIPIPTKSTPPPPPPPTTTTTTTTPAPTTTTTTTLAPTTTTTTRKPTTTTAKPAKPRVKSTRKCKFELQVIPYF